MSAYWFINKISAISQNFPCAAAAAGCFRTLLQMRMFRQRK